MLVNGSNLIAYQVAMGEAVLSAFKHALALSSPSTQIQEIESGGFPTVGLRISRGANSVVPVVVFKVHAKLGTQWLAEQSKDWATTALVEVASRMGVKMAEAAVSRPDGSAAVGIDRSSVVATFDKMLKAEDGYIMNFSVGLAVYPPREQDGIVVDVEQEIVDLGTSDVGSKLPDEATVVMGKLKEGIAAMANSPETDGAFTMMADMESADDLFW